MSKKKEKKRTFEAETMALPPLKMVLSETSSLDQPGCLRKKSPQADMDGGMREEVILRLIERLITKE
ncbi:MAG: hypothetical protein Fur0043_13270 [Anaerolineales bacterium]